MSEGDFERAATDVEESSEYYEEIVTDEEAMRAAAKQRANSDSDDDDDMGFYMPTVMGGKSAEKKPPLQKITKKVRRKKEKKPKASPDQRKSLTMGMSDKKKMVSSNPVLPNSTVSGGVLMKQTQSQEIMFASMDEKQILLYEIDQIKEKIKKQEEMNRSDLDKARNTHRSEIEALQKRQ
jgi:hypothetical protein